MEMDGGFGYIQNVGDFLARFSVLDQGGNLHFLGCQNNIQIADPAAEAAI